MKHLFTLLATIAIFFAATSQASSKEVSVSSPDGKTKIVLDISTTLSYSVWQDGENVVAPSKISMTLSDGTVWGEGVSIAKISKSSKDEMISTPFNEQTEIQNKYNESLVRFKGDWAIAIRAYDDGVAYRFISYKKGAYEVQNEVAEFEFNSDAEATVPYVAKEGTIEEQLFNSFENTYTTEPLSALDKNRLMFLPLSVKTMRGKRVTITESDLRNYPGMYLTAQMGSNSLKGFFAPLRNVVDKAKGHNNLQVLVKSRHNYIAKVDGAREFPWRVAVISRTDADLANTSIVYRLATPNKLGDISWVKPGKVAWEWWNDWNLKGVDFEAGVNNSTYKYYIDFASKNGIEYVILDEGWAVNKVYDLMQVVPEINIKELVDYGAERGVGIILWAGYHAFDRDMERVTKHYSEMGVKGFKVDFMDGDDQEMVYFNERAAQMTAKYKMLLDLHGTYKPTGLERTYPNIINYEGVHGLEQMKWDTPETDQVTYDVMIPYLRMIAGPMDYTQGAMNNAVYSFNSVEEKMNFQYQPCFTKPMSQGTRCRQLAQYIVFFSPLNMLCDSPTSYESNPIATDYIAEIPTVWDESKVIEGSMGEYIITARRKGDKWYIGGLTNWDARIVSVDVKAITGKTGKATLYKDGPNAQRDGTDFQKVEVNTEGKLSVRMEPGGGFALVIE